MQLFLGIFFLLCLILFNIFLFIFIDPTNTLINVLIIAMLILLLYLAFRYKGGIYYKLFPSITLLILPLLFSVNTLLVKTLGVDYLEPVEKYNMLSNNVSNSINMVRARIFFEKLETKSFIIYYPTDLRKTALQFRELESYTEDIKKQYFGDYKFNNVDVFLFEEEDSFFKRNFNHQGAIGRYIQGDIQIFYKRNNEKLMSQAFIHEYTHFLLSNYKKYHTNAVFPLWIEEGFAEYNRCVYIKGLNGKCFDNEFQLNSEIPLNLLETTQDWLDISDIDSAYYTSYLEVKKIIEENGKDFIIKYSSNK